jgi:hypothetical protein
MQSEHIFYHYVGIVADEWADGTYDWPQIGAAIEALHPTDIEQRAKALTLVIGLRAGERQKESPVREPARWDVLAELKFAKGDRKRSDIRGRARALAQKRADQIQSKLILGFFLGRGRDTVSKSDVDALLEAIECVLNVRGDDRQAKVSQLYGRFRSRVNRLKQEGGAGVQDEATALFETVYGMVLDYVY